MTLTPYQDLDVWKMAIDLTEDGYKLTAQFPREEQFGLSAQIKRAGVSIPANIAEGYGRDQTVGYIQFPRIALGSLRELETHLIIAERVKMAGQDELRAPREKVDRVGRMLRALIRSLEPKRASRD